MYHQQDAFNIAYDLIWKLFYYVFEIELDFREEFLALSINERIAAFERARTACFKYAIGRKIDTELGPVSEKFFLDFSRLLETIGSPRGQKAAIQIFPGGSPRISAKLAS